MKINFLTFIFIFLTNFCFSQETTKSVLKFNISALALGTYTLQYEKVLSDRVTFALGGGYRPEKLIPFAKIADRVISAADNRIEYISLENVKKGESKVGMFHITPEVRFYFGKDKAPIGTYISVFGKYNNYFGKVPVFVDIEYRGVPVRVELPVDTQLKTVSGGLMIGKQFRLGNRFTFDWYIVGGHYGTVKMHGQSDQNLEGFDDDFRTRLRSKIIDTFKINEKYLALAVDAQGVRIDNAQKLHYLNLRGFGFNLGYKF